MREYSQVPCVGVGVVRYASFDQSLYTYMEQNKKYELYHLFHFSGAYLTE
jgi:hypothetical protein